MKDIHDAVDIAWSTVGTVTPAGQQKLLLDYAAKSKGSKPSHTAMNVEDEGKGGGPGGREGGRVGGGQRGRGVGGERGRGSAGMRFGAGAHGGGSGNSRGQDGRLVERVEYPSPTRSSDRPSGRVYIGNEWL